MLLAAGAVAVSCHVTPSATPSPTHAVSPTPPSEPATTNGRLAPAPLGARIWADRVCTQGTATLILENNCGCNDALVCAVVRAVDSKLDLDLHTDRKRPKRCDDCFAMVPGRCAIPTPMAPGPWRVSINATYAFTITVARDGSLPKDTCWPR